MEIEWQRRIHNNHKKCLISFLNFAREFLKSISKIVIFYFDKFLNWVKGWYWSRIKNSWNDRERWGGKTKDNCRE